MQEDDLEFRGRRTLWTNINVLIKVTFHIKNKLVDEVQKLTSGLRGRRPVTCDNLLETRTSLTVHPVRGIHTTNMLQLRYCGL